MNFIKNIFKSNAATKDMNNPNVVWIPLTSLEQLEEIKEQSHSETIAIFKHSTRCGISRIVLRDFEKSFNKEKNNLKMYYLDLLNYRDVSNEISGVFKITHQSPQLLVIKAGEAVAHASHSSISQVKLEEYL